MKKLLITGASGFIGGFLVEEALNQGFDVYAGIRETSNLRYLQDARIQFFKTDLSDKNAIKQNLLATGNFDYIIHNAGVTKTCTKEMFDRVNYQFSKNLIEALHETHQVPDKFIHISSLAAYGPGNEKTLAPIKETDSPKPVSEYGKSKLKAEQYLQSLDDFPFLIFRPTGVYGPREKDYYLMYKSIKSGLETYIGTKNQYLTFIYVKDLARLLINALDSGITRKAYFVSDLKYYTAVEFNQLVKKELNKKTLSLVFPKFLIKQIAFVNEKLSCALFDKVPTLNTEKYKEISQTNWLCDSSALEKDFHFKPKYDLEKGVHEAIAWYKQKGLL
ncbi:MAG: NAD(P)-dependent oxidoreductase [Bacteroidales bacterium]|nr:NAD(P)-dependent oxidoreductase [Bacteroidales bacterium]